MRRVSCLSVLHTIHVVVSRDVRMRWCIDARLMERGRSLYAAVGRGHGEIGPAEEEEHAGKVDDHLASDALELAAPVGRGGRLDVGGQALKGVRLDRAGQGAERLHHGELSLSGDGEGDVAHDGSAGEGGSGGRRHLVCGVVLSGETGNVVVRR